MPSYKKAQKVRTLSPGFRLHRAVGFQPLVPPALQNFYARVAAGLKNLGRGDTRLIPWARAVGDDLSIARKIFQRIVREAAFYFSDFERNGAFDCRTARCI